jgi:hypothetical protein
MEKTFGELGLRVGGGGGAVYCHQGCCEHALSILDVRRIHPDDPQDISTYPLVTFRVKNCCLDPFRAALAAQLPKLFLVAFWLHRDFQ